VKKIGETFVFYIFYNKNIYEKIYMKNIYEELTKLTKRLDTNYNINKLNI